VIAEWVATHGTADQQDRHAAGMLPMKEALEGLADEPSQPPASARLCARRD
jgi:hypothetical protein